MMPVKESTSSNGFGYQPRYNILEPQQTKGVPRVLAISWFRSPTYPQNQGISSWVIMGQKPKWYRFASLSSPLQVSSSMRMLFSNGLFQMFHQDGFSRYELEVARKSCSTTLWYTFTYGKIHHF